MLDYDREAGRRGRSNGRGVFPWAKTATFRFWTAQAGQVTPDLLWPEAERRINAQEA